MQRVAGRTHAQGIDHGINRNDDGIGQCKAYRLGCMQRVAAQSQYQHTATDAQNACPCQGRQDLMYRKGCGQGHQQRRNAAHERIGQAQIAMLVSLCSGNVVADMNDH